MDALIWISENMELVLALAAVAYAILQLTSWGRANAKALQEVVDAIEHVGSLQLSTAEASAVKRVVGLAPVSLGVREAIEEAVAKVDVKKRRPTILRQVGRAVVPLAIRSIPRLVRRIFK